MCLSAVARSNKLCIVVTIDQSIGVQRSAIVRCADFLFELVKSVVLAGRLFRQLIIRCLIESFFFIVLSKQRCSSITSLSSSLSLSSSPLLKSAQLYSLLKTTLMGHPSYSLLQDLCVDKYCTLTLRLTLTLIYL